MLRIVLLTILSGVIVLLALTWIAGFVNGAKSGTTYAWTNAAIARATPTPVLPAYKTDTFNIGADSYQTMTLTMDGAPGTLEGYFLVNGGNSDISFSLEAPSGEDLYGPAMVQVRRTIDFSLPSTGVYVLKWDNSFSLLTPKQVTLYWRAYWLNR